jgi:hypothetical protein
MDGHSSAPPASAGTTYATSRRSPSPPGASRATTTASRTRGWAASAASTSPGSMRKPRTLTCASVRPRNSSTPPASRRARSPVRYIRAPASAENGSGTNRSPVSPGRPGYPRATLAPPMYSSPGTPGGAGSPAASSTYSGALPSGRPSRWRPPVPPPATACAAQITVPSVGP